MSATMLLMMRRGKGLKYKLNGLRVLLLVTAALVALQYTGVLSLPLLYQFYWESLAAAFTIGILASLALLARGLAIPEKDLVLHFIISIYETLIFIQCFHEVTVNHQDCSPL